MKTSKERVVPYITRDGSTVRELMHPSVHGNYQQSLAEARVKPGCITRLHKHRLTEELYHVISGAGLITLGTEVLQMKAGDTICISPGTVHCVENTEKQDLVFLCCCSPAYSHKDTELL